MFFSFIFLLLIYYTFACNISNEEFIQPDNSCEQTCPDGYFQNFDSYMCESILSATISFLKNAMKHAKLVWIKQIKIVCLATIIISS